MVERRRGIRIRAQLRLLVPLALAWTVTGIIVAGAGMQDAVPVQNLFLDAAALSDLPWYTGLLSNLGVLCWTTAVVIAACGSWIAFHTGRPSAAAFLANGAAATTVLLLDDLLLLHSDVLPQSFGIPKAPAMLMVIAPTIYWALSNLGEIARTRWTLLVAAGGVLAVSVAADRIGDRLFDTVLVEDGAKLFGVVAWMLYFATTSYDIARSTVRAAMQAEADVARDQTEPAPVS